MSKPASKEKGTTKKEQPKSSSAPGKTRSLRLYDEIDEDFEAAKAPTHYCYRRMCELSSKCCKQCEKIEK